MSTNESTYPMPSSVMGPQKNSFIYNKCQFCVNIFKWVPVVFITAVLAWGYYAYVFELCISTMESVILKIVCLICFHFFYIMTFWSYWQTIIAKPGVVPRSFWFTYADFERLQKETTEEGRTQIISEIIAERQLPVLCRTYSGSYRLCEKCNLIKPDRSHHCSVCGRCVLKMDHHCPWVNNCVSFTNYKYFVLFLGYAFTLCLYAAITSFYYFLKSWKNEIPNWSKFHILFLFFVSIMFAISLVSLFVYHLYLVFMNRSTLESFRAPVFRFGPDKNAFNLGKYQNWCQIFGTSKLKWFLPMYTSIGDGVQYPVKIHSEHAQDIQEAYTAQKSLLHSDSDRQRQVNQQTMMLAATQKQTNFYNSIPTSTDSGPLAVTDSAQASTSEVTIPLSVGNDEEMSSHRSNNKRVNDAGDDRKLYPV